MTGFLRDESTRPLRFLLAGGWNTLFGYLAFAALWRLLTPLGVHYLAVLLAANVVAVSQAFLLQKYFVFRTRSRFLQEFWRFAAIYGLSFLLNLVSLPVAVTIFGLHPLVAQGILVFSIAVLTYLAHKGFTFAPSP